MYPTVVVLSAREESAAHNSPRSILDALSLHHMHFDFHKGEK